MVLRSSTDKIVALIPARGGSKEIKGKNIKLFCGRPLIYWVLDAACMCDLIDEVYVSTDFNTIRKVTSNYWSPKLKIIDRSPESATDKATMASVMIDFAERVDFDHLVNIQATSPLLTNKDLTGGIEKYLSMNCDSLISTVVQKSFIWKERGGSVYPVGHDLLVRPRRQDWKGHLVQNGAFIIRERKALMESKAQVSGVVGAYEMPEETFMEIDSEADWVAMEGLMRWQKNIQ